MKALLRVRGFSLVEVVLAMAIVTFCLVLLIGILPAGLKTNKVSTDEFRAMNLMTALIADLDGTPPSQSKSFLYQMTPLPLSGQAVEQKEYSLLIDDQGRSIDPTKTSKEARFKVIYKYTRIPSAESLDPVEAWIKIIWPTMTPSGKGEGFVESYATFRKP